MADSDKGKLGLPALTALVVGGIIGSGIFSLPQNMAEGAGAGAILIAWAITFVGMLTLTRIFQWLSTTRPELDDGVYGYAREGFGEYLGFNAAWGYWISAWVGNAGYLVVLFSALGSFGALAFFGDGTTWPALLGELTVLWLMHAFVLHGVHNAAITNAIVTLAKVVPIALFILCVALAFRIETFHLDFWGSPALGSVTRQVETTMLYTVWVFLGIESATVYASHARHAADVSRATLLGFVVTLLLLVCVSVLSLGVVPQHELAQMKNPSMAQVMAAAVGPWGATLINVGLIVSVGGALLAWTMLAVEMLYLASRGPTHTAPALFGRTNAVETPAPALWLTSTLISALLLVAFLNASGYNALIQLATSMALIPYLLCAGFCLKLVARRPHSGAMLALVLLGTLYGVWLIYAAGLKYLLLSMILYAPGLGFFLHARRQRGLPAFGNRAEGSVAALVLVLALAALWMIGSGRLSL
ncbi:basic amino acid/polyamine antiporter [Pseudomonas aeruginosa]|nr:basic amino acid/polyamine antiporter [Pseudomonas aeruginosa]